MKSIILFSGGLDSTVCLYWAKKEFGKEITTLHFSYSQQNQSHELIATKKIIEKNDLLTHYYHIEIDKELIPVPKTYIGNFFIPGRNLLFLTLAGIFAYNHKIEHIVLGTRQLSRFPDCSDHFTKSAQISLHLALKYNITIHTPLMNRSKGYTIKLAQKLPGCMEALSYTRSCYSDNDIPCNNCEACAGRILAFEEAGMEDVFK